MMGKLKRKETGQIERVGKELAHKKRWEVRITLDYRASSYGTIVKHVIDRLGIRSHSVVLSHRDYLPVLIWKVLTKKEANRLADVVTQILFEHNPSVPHWYEIIRCDDALLAPERVG
jgi:hypothetical protein